MNCYRIYWKSENRSDMKLSKSRQLLFKGCFAMKRRLFLKDQKRLEFRNVHISTSISLIVF